MQKVLLLTTIDRPREYTADLKTNLEADLDVEVTIANLEDLAFSCTQNKVTISINDTDVSEYSAIYIKHWHMATEQAFVLAHYAQIHTIPTIPSECLRIVPKTKFGETFFLALHGLPVPDSVFFGEAHKYQNRYDEVVRALGSPFICKATGGKKGADNYLVKSLQEYEAIFTQHPEQIYILQKFIDNDGDYRLINFGDELKIAIYRTRGKDTHLNNTSQGGDGSLVPLDTLSDEIKKISLDAARLLGRELSGIDVVIGKDEKVYVFEVNYSPQLTTGTYLDVKRKEIASYFTSLLAR